MDIGELSGDPWNSGRIPQSKIHTSLRETSNGYLYGVSHCTAPNYEQSIFEVNGTFGDPHFGYRGAQMFRVQMDSGDVEYLGLAIPYEGCRSMEIVESLNKAYLVSYPRHCLYEFDFERRTSRLLGRIGTLGGMDIFKDKRDRIYGSYDNGRFFRYLPDDDEFEELSIRVPGIEGRENLYNFFFNVKKFREDFVCATGYYDGHIFRYNPEEGKEGLIEDYGFGWPDGWDGKTWTPPYVQAPVLYKNRWIFYGCNIIWKSTYLVRLDTKTNEKTVICELKCNNISSAWLSEGAISKDQSTLLFADVNMKSVPGVIMINVNKIN
ncbi:MAG: hypothetical protein KAQ69_12290 [Spirochaetales bacterium]|nr:hypothetical protein [Spirochaetales bacterium]